MTNLTEQILFDYFVEQNQKLTLADLSQHFDHTPPEELFKLVNNLVDKRFLDEDPLTLAWSLSSWAKRLIQQDLERTKQEIPLEKTNKGLVPTPKWLAGAPTRWKVWFALFLALGLAILILSLLSA